MLKVQKTTAAFVGQQNLKNEVYTNSCNLKPWLHTSTKFVELHTHASRGPATPRFCGYTDRRC